MNKLYRILLLLVFFGLGIPCASAANTISFNPQTTQMDIGSSQNVEVVMDEVPEGLAGFSITISVLDPEIAEITAVTLPDWCMVIDNPTVPSSSVTIEVIDLNDDQKLGATNVLLGTITLTGKKAGTSDLNISEGSTYDSDNPEFVYIIPSVIPGKVDVLDKEAPVINSVNLNNSNPNTGDNILVTVDATDNVGVSSIKANDVSLLNQEGNIWNGSITALAGTHFVNVSAMDGAGNIIWHNSTSYITNMFTPTITWSNPADIIYGTELSGDQLNAVATDPEGNTVAGNFAFTPAAGIVLDAGNDQPLHAEFTPADAGNYTTASKDVTINVSKSTPTITWSNPADITYGTALSGDQLNAAATDFVTGNMVAGNFAFTPAAGTVLDAGNDQPLHAEFTPADTANYTNASKDVTINVSEKPVTPVEDPVIPPQSISEIQSSPESTWINWTWTNPDDSNFDHTEIYLNGIFQTNTSAEYFNATDLQPETDYTLGTRTVDIDGNVNETWVNASAKTKPLPDIEQPTIDVDQPEIQSVMLFPANTTPDSKIDISTNVTDNIGVAEVTAGDAQLMNVDGNWQGNIIAPSSPGKYSLSIKANDAAGNTVDTSVPYNVVRRHGSVNLEILSTVSNVVAGENSNLAIKVKNTQNIDDTFKVQISVNGLPAFYRADASWFDWTEKTVNLKANEEVLIPVEVKVPVGTVTGLKVLKANVNSKKFSVHGSDNGYIVISSPYKDINKKTGHKGLWLGHRWIS